MASVKILEKYCKGCGLCVEFCPKGVLRISSRLNPAGLNPAEVVPGSDCSGCRNCITVCPDAAIILSVEVSVGK